MKKNIKKIIFVILTVGWSIGIIGDILKKDSSTSFIWAQFNSLWLLYIICCISIVLFLCAALSYLRDNKVEAYKFLFIALAVYLAEEIIEFIFESMMNKEWLIRGVTLDRQERGLSTNLAPAIVGLLPWVYIGGIIINVVIMFFVYRHWQKVSHQLQTKSNSAVIKKRRKK